MGTSCGWATAKWDGAGLWETRCPSAPQPAGMWVGGVKWCCRAQGAVEDALAVQGNSGGLENSTWS